MAKVYRITTQVTEFYEVEADSEEQAIEKLSLGDIEPIHKEYWGDDNVKEITWH